MSEGLADWLAAWMIDYECCCQDDPTFCSESKLRHRAPRVFHCMRHDNVPAGWNSSWRDERNSASFLRRQRHG